MSTAITVIVHEIEADGTPDMEELNDQVAFIHDGHVHHGWPLLRGPKETQWEDECGRGYSGVTHWLEFPVPVWELTGG